MHTITKNKLLLLFLTFIVGLLILVGGIKGQNGNPVGFQSDLATSLGSPFELSNSTARFALTESIVKYHSLFLNYNLAKFAAPDVVIHNGKYTSIFTPGVSLLAVPFYFIGDKFGVPQITSYLLITLFGLINAFLIFKLATKLGASFYSSLIAGFIFLFATNAFNYSFSFTQHNISTAIILLAIINALGNRNWITNILFGVLVGIGTLVDIPNIIMILPAGLYAFIKSFNFTKLQNNETAFALKLSMAGFVIGVIPLVLIFGWYNHTTTGSYTTLAQSIGRTDVFNSSLTEQNANIDTDTLVGIGHKNKTAGFNLPFDTRKQLNGFYILLVSNQRAWLFYSPVILLGVFGLWILLKNNSGKNEAQIIIATILIDIILYSMFGDPYGGWAFGPRYLIPGASLMCVGLAVFLSKNKNILYYSIFAILLIYSVCINSAGVLTTSAIPPKVEVDQMKNPIPYTYEYNFDLLKSGKNSSLVYSVFLADKIQPIYYYCGYSALIMVFFIVLNLGYIKEWKGDKENA
jgi:hypothetical protein